MNTNGLLVKPAHLAFFEAHDLIFILSIDGNRAMHDTERLTTGGAGSFDALAAKLPAFLEHNPGLTASIVVTPANVVHAADDYLARLRAGSDLPRHRSEEHRCVFGL